MFNNSLFGREGEIESFQRRYNFEFVPQDDITALETVWCAFFFVALPNIKRLEDFEKWNLIKRHFRDKDEH